MIREKCPLAKTFGVTRLKTDLSFGPFNDSRFNDLTARSDALRSKHHFHHHRRDHWYLAAGFAHLRGVEKTIATTASTAATSAATAPDSTGYSANAPENRRGTRPGILGSAGPAGRSGATVESTAAHANSIATTCTSPATGIDAAFRQTGIPHLAGAGKGNRGVTTAHENCAA